MLSCDVRLRGMGVGDGEVDRRTVQPTRASSGRLL